MTAKAPLAVSTMVYDDVDFLQIWLDYWRQHLPEEDLYVISDGPNPQLEAMAKGCNVIVRDRPEPHPAMEMERWNMLMAFMGDLLERYEIAIYTDVDEILVGDPNKGNVVDLIRAGTAPVRHPYGIELIQHHNREPGPIDLTRPILAQRQYFRASGRFSKPCILREPTLWCSGGHLSSSPDLAFARGVHAVHLRFFDSARFLDRARRRRTTIEAPSGLDQVAYRRWRSSDAEAEKLIKSFERIPVMPFRSISPAETVMRMRWSYPKTPDANGHYAFKLRDSKLLQRLPKRFLDLF